jgi:hypothetical protein
LEVLSHIKFLSLSLLLALVISFGSYAENLTGNSLVKQSLSGICHYNSSGSFNRTKNYIPFDSITACIETGGCLPKGKIKLLMKLQCRKVSFQPYMIGVIGLIGAGNVKQCLPMI